jgi:hypothetical protein
MERVREPSELVLDENDDHLIFEIPTDPSDSQSRQQQRNRESREKADLNTSISPTKAGKVPHKVYYSSKRKSNEPIDAFSFEGQSSTSDTKGPDG